MVFFLPGLLRVFKGREGLRSLISADSGGRFFMNTYGSKLSQTSATAMATPLHGFVGPLAIPEIGFVVRHKGRVQERGGLTVIRGCGVDHRLFVVVLGPVRFFRVVVAFVDPAGVAVRLGLRGCDARVLLG